MNSAGLFNTARTKLLSFVLVAVLHITLILFVSFRMEVAVKTEEPVAGVMKLVDVEEELPPPPPPPPPEKLPEILQTTNEAIAETMIETDETPPPVTAPVQTYTVSEQIEYLPQHRISYPPGLKDIEDELMQKIIYPPIARRSNIEGMVYLELFIDRQGNVRNVRILREDPPNRGFGEATLNAFNKITKSAKPAEANGTPVAVRYRYNLRFQLK